MLNYHCVIQFEPLYFKVRSLLCYLGTRQPRVRSKNGFQCSKCKKLSNQECYELCWNVHFYWFISFHKTVMWGYAFGVVRQPIVEWLVIWIEASTRRPAERKPTSVWILSENETSKSSSKQQHISSNDNNNINTGNNNDDYTFANDIEADGHKDLESKINQVSNHFLGLSPHRSTNGAHWCWLVCVI